MQVKELWSLLMGLPPSLQGPRYLTSTSPTGCSDDEQEEGNPSTQTKAHYSKGKLPINLFSPSHNIVRASSSMAA